MRIKNKLFGLWLIITIIMGFLTILFFSLIYLNNNVLCDLNCRGRNEVVIALVMFSLVGMFVGSLTYYFISEKYEKKIGKMHKNMESVYRLLDNNQREVFKKIIEFKGQTSQANLVKATKFSRVKISRILKKLEEKGVIEKDKTGFTNKIILIKDLEKLFL